MVVLVVEAVVINMINMININNHDSSSTTRHLRFDWSQPKRFDEIVSLQVFRQLIGARPVFECLQQVGAAQAV